MRDEDRIVDREKLERASTSEYKNIKGVPSLYSLCLPSYVAHSRMNYSSTSQQSTG